MCSTLFYVKTPRKRNLTLSLPAELIRAAKIQAAQSDMSLNAWVQQAIDQSTRFNRSYIAAGEKILAAAEKQTLKMPKKGWTRAELYDR